MPSKKFEKPKSGLKREQTKLLVATKTRTGTRNETKSKIRTEIATFVTQFPHVIKRIRVEKWLFRGRKSVIIYFSNVQMAILFAILMILQLIVVERPWSNVVQQQQQQQQSDSFSKVTRLKPIFKLVNCLDYGKERVVFLEDNSIKHLQDSQTTTIKSNERIPGE